ncbi:hypothetical protein BDR05DRAFT_1006677 [Suillus weaverae]|nr:hypothetical protein BDR05DRAFT_1006677 [Suillus weaverae]
MDDIFMFRDIATLGSESEGSSSLTIGRALDMDNRPKSALNLMQEDIQPLLGSVDTPMNACLSSQESNSMTAVDSSNIYNTVDDMFAFLNITTLGSEPEGSSSLAVGRALDMDNQPISALNLMQEDIQPLLGSVDTPMNACLSSQESNSMTAVDSSNTYNTMDDMFMFPDFAALGSEPEGSSSLTAGRALDMVNQPISASNLRQEDIQPLLCSVHTNMDPCLCAQESDSMILVDSTNTCNTVDDTSTLSDNAPLGGKSVSMNIEQATDDSTCVSSLPEMTISAGSMLKPFPLPFDWCYCKRALRTMGVHSIRVDLSRWLIAHIVVRIRELYGLEEDAPLDNIFQQGYECQATYEEYCEIYGMSKFLSAVEALAEERQSVANFFVCAARGLRLSGMVECGVQCDIESQLDPRDVCTDTAHTTLPTSSLTNNYQTKIENVLPSDDHNDCSAHQSHISLHGTQPSFTVDPDNPCVSADAWMLAVVDAAVRQSEAPTVDTTPENNSDPPSDHDTGPRTRSRARNVKKATYGTVPTQKRRREKSISQNDVVEHRARTERPVIFAAPLVQSKKKGRTRSAVVKYTIDDLMKGCEMDPTIISPSICLFLLDPMRDDYIQKNTASQYNVLLNVARFVASALTTKSLSDTTITAAASLMKIEFWLEDVALDCKVALDAKDMSLSPLAHHVLVELSTRASVDASSLSISLEGQISAKSSNGVKAMADVIRYLCKLRCLHAGADVEFERLLYNKVLLEDEDQASQFLRCYRLRQLHIEPVPSTTAMYFDGGIQSTTIIDILSLCTGITNLSLVSEEGDELDDLTPLHHVLDNLPLTVLSLHIGATLTNASVINFTVFSRLTHLEINDVDMLQHVDMDVFPQLTHLALWPFLYNPTMNIPRSLRRLLKHPTLQVLLFRVERHNECATWLVRHEIDDRRIIIAPPEIQQWDDFGHGSMLLWELADERVNMPGPNHGKHRCFSNSTFVKRLSDYMDIDADPELDVDPEVVNCYVVGGPEDASVKMARCSNPYP